LLNHGAGSDKFHFVFGEGDSDLVVLLLGLDVEVLFDAVVY
jgi:hypothetical protein